MKISEHRALRGPNMHARTPVIHFLLDVGEMEGVTSDRVPGLAGRLVKLLPGLRERRVAGEPVTHADRIERGAPIAEVVARVALELQTLAGCPCADLMRATPTRDAAIHRVVHRYDDEEAGMMASREAVVLVESVIALEPFDVADCVDHLRRVRESNSPGPSTGSMLDEARRRGIPVMRLDEGSYYQLGHGARRQTIQASVTGRTSGVGIEIADDKERTKRILARHGMPVPRGESVGTLGGALDVADKLGYPVVVKPLVGNHGRGITVGVRNPEELEAAFDNAKAVYRTVLVERVLLGADFRLLVVNHRFVAAARRDPAHVVGDGASTIQQLVDATNADPRRGEGHEKIMTKIHLDEATLTLLAKGGMTLESVPAAGQVVLLKTTANLSSGGTATDVTDEVHPAIRTMAERMSRLIGLDVMGIDVVAPHLRLPLQQTGGGICEVNAAPGFRMHLAPSSGTPRNVAAPVLDMLFPQGETGTIPIVAITGTNGKTTTTRLVAHILRANGGVVGMACTNGVEVQGQPILEGDYSGPSGAEAVLTEPTVDHAVIEVARGGILRRGLGFDECDVGVLLNVTGDHLGEGGIDTLEDLARLKGVVPASVKAGGAIVLNAEDPMCLRFKDDRTRRVILFSLDERNEELRRHVAAGHTAVTVREGVIMLVRGGSWMPVAHVNDVPITLHGKVAFNVANALAAIAAAHSLGVPETVVAHAVTTFSPTVHQLPGRMNMVDLGTFKVLVDYGHNPPALRALGAVLPQLATGRLVNVASGSGNRRDEDLREFGATIAGIYDHVILCDPDPRGRSLGVTPELIRQGLCANGFRDDDVQVILNEDEAIETALSMARPGDLVVLQVDDVKGTLAKVAAWRPPAVAEAEETTTLTTKAPHEGVATNLMAV